MLSHHPIIENAHKNIYSQIRDSIDFQKR